MWTRKEYHHVDKGVVSLYKGEGLGNKGKEVREVERMVQWGLLGWAGFMQTVFSSVLKSVFPSIRTSPGLCPLRGTGGLHQCLGSPFLWSKVFFHSEHNLCHNNNNINSFLSCPLLSTQSPEIQPSNCTSVTGPTQQGCRQPRFTKCQLRMCSATVEGIEPTRMAFIRRVCLGKESREDACLPACCLVMFSRTGTS